MRPHLGSDAAPSNRNKTPNSECNSAATTILAVHNVHAYLLLVGA